MKRQRAPRVLLRALGAALALLALSTGAGAASTFGALGTEVIAQNGFGDRDNSYAWSMGWLNGKLYVGTGRDVLCVENETVQHFLPLLSTYVGNPSPGVHCPRDPYHMDLRAEIWQYTPSSGTWRRVFRSRTEENPLAPERRVASDIAYRGMVTYTNPSGKKALYAAGVTADEYLPPLLETNPPRILRSYDGVHWRSLNLPHVVVHYPGGNVQPMGFRSLIVWRHHLYVTATPDLTGDGALFEISQPWSGHPGLVQVSPPNVDVFEVAAFGRGLYLGAGDAKSGYSVWRATAPGHRFVPLVTGGAGRGHLLTSVVSMQVFRNSLYVGASGWYNRGTLPLSELIRIQRDGRWSLVVGNPRTLPNGATAYPTSGLGDGFGSLFNAHFWRMAAQDGGLYVGTNSWSYALKGYVGNSWLTDVLAADVGYQMWATCNGVDFFPVTRDAFGVSEYDFGARTLQAGSRNGEELYIGSANHAQGTMVLVDRAPACSSLIHRRRRVAPPAAMIADSLGGRTLLSWKPSHSAVRYEVLAASEAAGAAIPEGAADAAERLPDGRRDADAHRRGRPRRRAGDAGAIGRAAAGGEHRRSVLRRPHRRRGRCYAVRAVNAAGEASDPSNVQAAPVPEPAPTFGSLRQTLASGWTTAATAAVKVAARATARRHAGGVAAGRPRRGAARAATAAGGRERPATNSSSR